MSIQIANNIKIVQRLIEKLEMYYAEKPDVVIKIKATAYATDGSFEVTNDDLVPYLDLRMDSDDDNQAMVVVWCKGCHEEEHFIKGMDEEQIHKVFDRVTDILDGKVKFD